MSEAHPLPIPPELEAALPRCESEPIHQLAMVQPHVGLLVAGPAPDYPVLQVSANLEQFLDSATASLLGPALPAALGSAPGPATAHASPRQWVAALPVAERLRAQVASGSRAPDGHPITISLGVTDWCAQDNEASFLARADEALYQAKGAGRNRVVARACAGGAS